MERERFGSCSWGADNNQTNIEKHGWSFQRAAIALQHGHPVPADARTDGREEHYAHLNGETIKVVFERCGNELQLITAHTRSEFAGDYDSKAAAQGIEKNREFNREFEQWRVLDHDQRRLAEPAVKKRRQAEKLDKKELAQRADIDSDRRAQLGAQLKERHREEAIEDRRPRLEHDVKERAQLAQEQSHVRFKEWAADKRAGLHTAQLESRQRQTVAHQQERDALETRLAILYGDGKAEKQKELAQIEQRRQERGGGLFYRFIGAKMDEARVKAIERSIEAADFGMDEARQNLDQTQQREAQELDTNYEIFGQSLEAQISRARGEGIPEQSKYAELNRSSDNDGGGLGRHIER